ncbi:unnamed protein product [Lymnaea stagnalis]|uniref:Uncharacterized protein n=1 Tax=Lymnaea stagnalis TaxID=6523 RepID=A0AAV2HR74_LYMST
MSGLYNVDKEACWTSAPQIASRICQSYFWISTSGLLLVEMTCTTAKRGRMVMMVMTPLLLMMIAPGTAQAVGSPQGPRAPRWLGPIKNPGWPIPPIPVTLPFTIPTGIPPMPSLPPLPDIKIEEICKKIIKSLGQQLCDKFGIGECVCNTLVNYPLSFVCG